MKGKKEREKNKMTVILDTNFLVDMFRFKISFEDIEDIVERRCDFWVVEASVKELKKMTVKESKVALKMIESKIGVLKSKKKISNADNAIVSFIRQSKKETGQKELVVATNDAKLRKKIKALGIRVIYLRARKHLEIH